MPKDGNLSSVGTSAVNSVLIEPQKLKRPYLLAYIPICEGPEDDEQKEGQRVESAEERELQHALVDECPDATQGSPLRKINQ